MLSRSVISASRIVKASASPARTFVSRSKPRLSGDDHHAMFHPPFGGKLVAGSLIAIVAGGVGVIAYSCTFQNKKHGFTK